MLVAWGHPLGHVLLEEARRTRPDFFRLETSLARFLADDPALAVRPGGRAMAAFVARAVDSRNLVTALLLAGSRSERPAAEAFAEGGEHLGFEDFVRAAESVHREEAAELLARATRGSLFEEPLRESPATPTRLATRLLDARIEQLRKDGRRDPLSPSPVLLFVLRLRREAVKLRRALWGSALIAGADR
jgi:vacuolar-type H+-ATPase subunit C/Vma6